MKRIALVLAAALLVGACGGDETESAELPAAGEDAVEEAADAEDDDAEDGEWDGPTIPSGTYTKVMTADEALAELTAVGVSEATATQVVVDEIASDEVEITFRIDDGVWAQFMTWRGNHDSLSARGVYTYTEEGEWAIVEDPCPDDFCEFPVRTWTFADNVLTLNADTDWAEVRDFYLELDDDVDHVEWFFANVVLIFNGEFEKVE